MTIVNADYYIRAFNRASTHCVVHRCAPTDINVRGSSRTAIKGWAQFMMPTEVKSDLIAGNTPLGPGGRYAACIYTTFVPSGCDDGPPVTIVITVVFSVIEGRSHAGQPMARYTNEDDDLRNFHIISHPLCLLTHNDTRSCSHQASR